MLPQLISKKFDQSFRQDVQAFTCSTAVDRPWEKYLDDWIKGPEPDEDIQKFGNEVWLYYLGEKLVGYGSIGKNSLSWPYPSGKKKEVVIIPTFAVSSEFRGKPPGPDKSIRYSWQIFEDLVGKSLKYGLDDLVLYVHESNSKAIKFYVDFGFASIGKASKKNPNHNVMALDIRNAVAMPPAVADTTEPDATASNDSSKHGPNV